MNVDTIDKNVRVYTFYEFFIKTKFKCRITFVNFDTLNFSLNTLRFSNVFKFANIYMFINVETKSFKSYVETKQAKATKIIMKKNINDCLLHKLCTSNSKSKLLTFFLLIIVIFKAIKYISLLQKV